MKSRIMVGLLFCALFVYAGSALAFTEGTNNYFGTSAGGTGGNQNSFFGGYAGNNNTGSDNTFIGYDAGESNIASWNTFIGMRAGWSNTIGSKNVFLGYQSGYKNTTGYMNTFNGYQTGYKNTIGMANTFNGYQTGYNNVNGQFNTFNGYQAGYHSTNSSNTFNGYMAGHNSTGLSNTFIGSAAGVNTSTGNSNNFLGESAGYGNTTGSGNISIGYRAGYYNTTGSSNTLIGNYAGTSGNASNNTFLGANVGSGSSTGSQNTFLGGSAGATSTGSNNVFIGYQSGYNETGSNKLYIANSYTSSPLIYGDFSSNIVNINGVLGVGTDSPSSRLTVVGVIESTTGGIKFPDGSTMTSANSVTGNFDATGEYQIDSTTVLKTESTNTYLGKNAGASATGTGSVFLGYNAGTNESNSNRLYIANSSTATPLIYGEFDNSFVEVNGDFYVTGNTYVDSDNNLKEDIKPIESSLDKVLGIQGVSFKWKDGRYEGRKSSDSRHYGVIAQQVEKVIPEIVVAGKNNIKKVAYMELVPVLIEAMKEQQKTISDLSEKLTKLEQDLKLKGSFALTQADSY